MKNVWLTFFFFALVACTQNKKIADKAETDGGDKVYSFSPDDADMNAAIVKANKTYPEFLRLFSAGDSSLSRFSVKMFFEYGEGREHMWVTELYLENGKLFGLLDSDPMYIDSLERGDTLLVSENAVSDWLYVKNGKMVGGYTLKVTYNNLDSAEKKELKAVVPFEIE